MVTNKLNSRDSTYKVNRVGFYNTKLFGIIQKRRRQVSVCYYTVETINTFIGGIKKKKKSIKYFKIFAIECGLELFE